MSDSEQPQIYLITPQAFELSGFQGLLAGVLDSVPVACVRLSLSETDEQEVARIADCLRETCHERDVALVISRHFRMVERLGLDGCHLEDGAKQVRAVRKELGQDAIIGAFCGTSRHDGINAGEAGADYVSFGPVTGSELGDGTIADIDLFEWWSEMIEVPVVAEGRLTPEIGKKLAEVTDFLGVGPEIWSEDDPAKTLKEMLSFL